MTNNEAILVRQQLGGTELRIKFPPCGQWTSHVGRIQYVTNKAEQFQFFGNSNSPVYTEEFEGTWMMRVTLFYTKVTYGQSYSRWAWEYLKKHFENMRMLATLDTFEDFEAPRVDLMLFMIPERQVDLIREMLISAMKEHFGEVTKET